MVKKRILKVVNCLRFSGGYAYVASECEGCDYFAGIEEGYVKCKLDDTEQLKRAKILRDSGRNTE